MSSISESTWHSIVATHFNPGQKGRGRRRGPNWRETRPQHGTLLEGATLFWDEPEANLNPALISTLVGILLQLQQQGVQLFVATHSYVVLKEFDLQHTDAHPLRYFVFDRDPDTREITARTADHYLATLPHPVAQAYEDIYNREVQQALEGVL